MRLYNTLTGALEEFAPIGDEVRLYVCGVTPYDEAHVGHAMSAIVFDVLRRYLEFRGYAVRHVQNFTDIDDKIIERARATGEDWAALARRYSEQYVDDLRALNVLPAHVYPRATEEIPAIIEMIGGLIERGYAYAADGDVYYRVRCKADYGKLSHQSVEALLAGERADAAEAAGATEAVAADAAEATGAAAGVPGAEPPRWGVGGWTPPMQKESPVDFALWKGAKPGEPAWESPWGPGRPGWHIECSAMSWRYLGEQLDLHGGGTDLIFPHHENEIAQSEAFTGVTPFVRTWVHNGMLNIEGQKMSKSLGNVIRIGDVLARHGADAFRLFVLSGGYRKPLNFTEEGIAGNKRGAERLRAAIRRGGAAEGGAALDAQPYREQFIAQMDQDLNTSGATAALFGLAGEINRAADAGDDVREAQATLLELAGVLGLRLDQVEDEVVAATPFIDLLIEVRRELRAAKQFQIADGIRARLAAMGVTLEDSAAGTTWRLG